MCGICGIINLDNCAVNSELIREMAGTILHRGPDSTGCFTSGNVGLGHTRLSIIDTSDLGNQPMHSGFGHSLVFNGEIYNFSALKRKLSAKCEFKSNSDTEVLLMGLSLYGTDFLQQIEGMFAFAFWDSNTRTLILARDRMGQKPLYYSELEHSFLFASEPHALLIHPDFNPEPDLNTLYHYLSVQSCPAPMSAFKSMKKLGPGQALIFKNKKSTIIDYWKPDFSETQEQSEEEAVDNLISKLKESVSKCLISDVPLGLFLSGGVDSSLIAAIASEISNTRLKSFTIGFNEERYDERIYARKVAEHCGLDHHELLVRPSTEIIDTVAERYAEPFADSSAIPTYYLSQFTKQHVTVALSGDGGDDIFAGYERYLNPFLFPDISCLPQSRLEEYTRDMPFISGEAIGDSQADSRKNKLGTELFFYYRHWARFYGRYKFNLCRKEFIEQAAPKFSVDLFLGRDGFDSRSCLQNIIEFELKYYLASTLMPKVDVMSMTHSLEVRAPLLEPDIVKIACALPENFKVRQEADVPSGENKYTAKYILKKAAERFIPKDVIYRPKMGFGVPIGDWMRNEYKEFLYDSLLSSKARSRGYFNMNFVEELIDRHMNGENLHYPLWSLLMLELWHQKHVDR